MPQETQSYFGDVLKKLSDMGRTHDIPIDQGFKQKLKEELMNQSMSAIKEEAIKFPEPIALGHVEIETDTPLVVFVKKWQALFVGIPILLTTVFIVFVLRGVFFVEHEPETVFEKAHHVSYTGPFTKEERNGEFKGIVSELIDNRDSESVNVTRKNSDRIFVEVKIKNDGKEEFEIVRDGSKWHSRSYRLFESEV